MSTTALAIPNDAREPIFLPSFTVGKVYIDHFELKPFNKLPCENTPFDTELMLRAYPLIIEELKREKTTVGLIRNNIKPKLFPNGQSYPTSQVIYETLRALKKQGVLKYENGTAPGRNGLTAPKTYFWLE